MQDTFRMTFSFNFVVAVDRAGIAAPGYGRIKTLAALFDVSTTTIQKWLTGDSLPEMGRLTEICEKLHCSLDDLILGPQHAKLSAAEKEITRVSLLSNDGHVVVPVPDQLFSSTCPREHQNLFRSGDDMMLNYVAAGEVLWFSKETTELVSGRVFVFYGGGRLFVRRVQMLSTGTFMMLCDNTLFPPEDIDPSIFMPFPSRDQTDSPFDFGICDLGKVYVVGCVIGRLIFR